MDRRLLERVIGAGVLFVLLLLIVPAVLDGDREGRDGEPGTETETDSVNLRTHTIRSDGTPDGPPVPQPAPQSVGVEAEEAPPAAAEPAEVTPSEPAAPAATTAGTAAEPPKLASAPRPETAAPPAEQVPPAEPPATTRAVPAPPAAQPPAGTGWSVQLGSFSRQDNAERLAAELQAKGFPAFLQPTSQSGKTLYRVRVGPVSTREVAGVLAARLDEAGYRGQVTSN